MATWIEGLSVLGMLWLKAATAQTAAADANVRSYAAHVRVRGRRHSTRFHSRAGFT